MIAQVGDKLLADGNRVGLIIAATHEDGTPPYIVKWISDGHVAMVFPDQHMRVERAGNEPPGSDQSPVARGPISLIERSELGNR